MDDYPTHSVNGNHIQPMSPYALDLRCTSHGFAVRTCDSRQSPVGNQWAKSQSSSTDEFLAHDDPNDESNSQYPNNNPLLSTSLNHSGHAVQVVALQETFQIL